MLVKHPKQLKSYFEAEKINLSLITVTGIIYNIGMTAGPYFEGRMAQCLYDISNHNKEWLDMFSLAAIYIGVILLVQFSRALKRFYVRRFANNTSKNMRIMLYNSIVHTDKAELESQQLGTIMTKAVSDVDACVEGMRKFTTEIFDTGIVLVAYAVMLCTYDARLALLSCVFIPCAYIIAEKCKGIVTKYNNIYKKTSGRLNQATMDLIGNAVTYRVFGLEHERNEAYDNNLSEYEASAVKANIWESAMQPVYYAIAMCGSVIIFYFGSKNVMGTGWTVWNIGSFTTFFSCFTKLALKSSKAAKLYNAVQKAEVSWERIKPMFREYREDKPLDKLHYVQKLSFDNVDVSYPGCDKIVKGVTFTAHKGQVIGVTGAVASGKTAIGKVFTGETEYSGNIWVNDIEYGEYGADDRNAIVTYMGHEVELMSTSIIENILLGASVESCGENRKVDKCLDMVCLRQEVDEMADGIETVVGNGGIRMSGGQQSRLSLARSIMHCKDILVLDDPFSAVDKTTEQSIFHNMCQLTDGRITFLISHRLSLFAKLDGVVFLHDGTASFGTHDELMTKEPEYARSFMAQGGVHHAQ